MIPFNKPFLSGKETDNIKDAVLSGKISGNGKYTQLCHQFFNEKYPAFGKCLLTTSCTDALEMSAILTCISPGDEVIIPSYTFVSTANAFALRGAKIVFADSSEQHPNIDENTIESLITPKTKAIVPVHYAGMACNMSVIKEIANKHNLYVVEDAAQAIDSHFINDLGQRIPLGSIGDTAAFSFHETKNIISGEGGMLTVNNPELEKRAEIIWEKGTNRSAFFRGEIDKYGWVDIGSSFLPSEIVSAFLYAQLENLNTIQNQRIKWWNLYNQLLSSADLKGRIDLPEIPVYAENNAHMYYIVCESLDLRNTIIARLKAENIHAVFHYQSLHASPYYASKHDGRVLKNSDRFTDTLLRLPMFYELTESDIVKTVNIIKSCVL